MTRPLAAELVEVTTEDGLIHTGAVVRPPDGTSHRPPILWFHGGGGNFYMPGYLRIARALAERGYAVVLANTRGHDHTTMQMRRGTYPALGGVAWERFEECDRDVAA